MAQEKHFKPGQPVVFGGLPYTVKDPNFAGKGSVEIQDEGGAAQVVDHFRLKRPDGYVEEEPAKSVEAVMSDTERQAAGEEAPVPEHPTTATALAMRETRPLVEQKINDGFKSALQVDGAANYSNGLQKAGEAWGELGNSMDPVRDPTGPSPLSGAVALQDELNRELMEKLKPGSSQTTTDLPNNSPAQSEPAPAPIPVPESTPSPVSPVAASPVVSPPGRPLPGRRPTRGSGS